MSGVERLSWRRQKGAAEFVFSQSALTTTAIAAETATIIASAIVAGVGYQSLIYGETGSVASYAAIGCLTSLFFVLPVLSQGCHDATAYVSGRRGASYVSFRWHTSLVLLGIVGFLTKSTGSISRGWIIVFYGLGLIALLLLNRLMRALVLKGVGRQRIASRRLMLLGTNAAIDEFWLHRRPKPLNDQIVSVVRIPSRDEPEFEAALDAALSGAPTHARPFDIEAAVILSDGMSPSLIRRCTERLAVLPISVHLDAGSAFDSVATVNVERIGGITAVTLARKPLDVWQSAAKRAFDIAVASMALVALSPVLLALAVVIRLDSPGPVLFRQRRRGYNQREFRIVKFRSMTTLDDGDTIEQAKVGDLRITRVGAWLRRFNLDELPQLWNVLAGDMSIVGPRPHAVAHDRRFETRIEHYPRRLNVKPGITGGAQVNGLRGETDTDDKMSRRVAFDLHYIDNWSLWFDVKIILMTLLSPQAFTNAR